MKTFKNCACQGELMFTRVDKLPKKVKLTPVDSTPNGRIIVGHSETGHHHYVMENVDYSPGEEMSLLNSVLAETKARGKTNEAIKATMDKASVSFFSTEDPNVNYLKVAGKFVDLIHDRSFDTHETLRIPHGLFKVTHQQEFTPSGWQKVQD